MSWLRLLKRYLLPLLLLADGLLAVISPYNPLVRSLHVPVEYKWLYALVVWLAAAVLAVYLRFFYRRPTS